MRHVHAFPWRGLVAGAAAAAILAGARPAEARVRKLVIDARVSPAFNGATFGAAGQYETIAGRVFGEIDPADPHNTVITDLRLARRNANGKVEYVATFFLVKPIDMSKSSRLMWQDAPNRSGRITIQVPERAFGDIGLSSGWQGDHSGRTVPGPNNDYAIVPIAVNADDTPVTGPVIGRIANASGVDSQPLMVHANPLPYAPLTLDTTKATLTTHASEEPDGMVKPGRTIAASDWAWARCSADNPFPGTPDPTRICVKGGFDPALLYQIVYTAKDPYVLGVGFAAFRDMASFFRNATQDDEGTPNPVAGGVSWVIARGVSQAGNFVRALLHLGFTQDESNRTVYDGAWPISASRILSLNTRFGTPDGSLKLYEVGSEGVQWWTDWRDPVRNLPSAGMLDRCTATQSCPKIVEHNGAAEFWDLKLSPAWIGTDARQDLPLPPNVRRYYIAGTQHNGGRGGFSVTTQEKPAVCPGDMYGVGMLPPNPVPQTQTMNAIRAHFRDWVMKGTPPPPSVYPTLASHALVDPTPKAMGFPAIPGLPANAPTGVANPLQDYDWGRDFHAADVSGAATLVPPTIRKVIGVKVPRVNADGNEFDGVPVVLRDAPLGTYLGWNITADGFFKGRICNYAGGMIPFATTKAERLASHDPRLSLEERYATHDGYVSAVKGAAARAVASGFLLQPDADALIKQAEAGNVLE